MLLPLATLQLFCNVASLQFETFEISVILVPFFFYLCHIFVLTVTLDFFLCSRSHRKTEKALNKMDSVSIEIVLKNHR